MEPTGAEPLETTGAVPRNPAVTPRVKGVIDVDTLRRLVAAGDIDTVIVAGVDVQGKLYGKRFEATHFVDSGCTGTLACAAALAWDVEETLVEGIGFVGWHTGYHDFALVADLNTIRVLPWFEKTALVLCDAAHEDGSDILSSPRTVLKNLLGRAASMGYDVYSASELEFHLLRETTVTARQKGYVSLDLMHDYVCDYNVFRGSLDDWFFRQIRNHLTAAGVPVESNKPEYGCGQAEVNLAYSEALEMADRHAVYKQGVKEIAALNNIMVTFMAKPFTEHSGSSCHLHMSLWQQGSDHNLFYDHHGEHGMSDTMRHFMAGVMRLAPEFFLLYAPYINSYKRFVPESFAPCRNAWGMDNRTVAFRVAGHGKACRLENRIPGADVNGYLVAAGMLASGLYGIEHQLEPLSPPAQGNAYYGDAPLFPRNLVEATELFTTSERTRELLGDTVVDDLTAFARHEIQRYFTEVTDWERRAYMELI